MNALAALELRTRSGKRVVLRSSPLVVGRGDGANLRFRIPEMAEKNTLFVRIDGLWMAFDLRTERKLICNGMAMESVVLAPGQRIKFGGCALEVVGAQSAPAAEEAALSTLLDDSTSVGGAGRLHFSGAHAGAADVGGDLLIGSDAACGLVLPAAAGVSRKHAYLVWRYGDPWLVDLRSRNGIQCGGRTERVLRLRDAPRFELGGVNCRWERLRPDGAEVSSAAPSDSGAGAGAPGAPDPHGTLSEGAKSFRKARELAARGDRVGAVRHYLEACGHEPLETSYRGALRELVRGAPDRGGLKRLLLGPALAWRRTLGVRAVRQLGDLPRALALGEAALALAPDCIPLHWELARAFAALERGQGRFPQATLWQLFSLREVNAETMSDPRLNALIGHLLVDMGQFHRIEAVLANAFRQHPRDSLLRAVEERASVERIVAQQRTAAK